MSTDYISQQTQYIPFLLQPSPTPLPAFLHINVHSQNPEIPIVNRDMLRTMKTKSAVTGALSPAKTGGRRGGGGGDGGSEVAVWELRPGGMLVQKRSSDCNNHSCVTITTIKVKVKYGSSYHEAKISSQATFGIFLDTFMIFVMISVHIFFVSLHIVE